LKLIRRKFKNIKIGTWIYENNQNQPYIKTETYITTLNQLWNCVNLINGNPCAFSPEIVINILPSKDFKKYFKEKS
jgi:hypothetical protein